jgi:hypothetical protein
VQGSGHFKNLRGRVIDQKETGFGVKFALVKPDNGSDPEWANELYLAVVKFTSEDLSETGFDGS